MADSNKVEIGFNAKTDKASSDVKKLGKEVEKAGNTAKSASKGFDQARAAVGRFNSAIRAITNISFIAGGIASVVQLWHLPHPCTWLVRGSSSLCHEFTV